MAAAPPPAKGFPIEVWMRIFEHLICDNDAYARPKVVMWYSKALGDHAAIPKVLKKLPPFERRFWSTTRNYYAINRNSRAAAVRLHLSRELLASHKQPVKLTCQALQRVKEHMPSGTAVVRLINIPDPAILHTHNIVKMLVNEDLSSCIHFLDDYEHVVILAPLPSSRGSFSLFSELLEFPKCAGEMIQTDRRERGVAAARIEAFL